MYLYTIWAMDKSAGTHLSWLVLGEGQNMGVFAEQSDIM
jgi:hypothetical protein